MAKTDDSYRPDSSKRFGLALKRLLERKQLSQREFAKQADLTPDYVSKLVNGSINEPRKSTVEKIANGLGIPVEELWRQVEQCTETTESVPLDCPAETDLSERDSLVEAPPIAEADPQVPQKFVVGLDVLRTVPVWLGRDQLLQQLQTEFVGTGQERNLSRPVVLVLVGQGGIGKTSLAVKLLEAVGLDLRRAELAHQSVYAGVICWRVEEGSSFDEVSSFLLAALGMESAEPVKEAGQKIQQIIQGLQRQRYLLLLDNLEVILQPARQPEAGRTVQPEWGQLLNAMVYRPHQSQMILTSREVPVDLGDLRYPDLEPDSALVRIERLGGVDVAAGAEILSQRQVQDSEADRCWVAERVEGHVFVLTQLAAVAKGKPGYLRQHPQLVTQKADPILREQLARQSEPARELLKRMCVLRRSADIRALTFLRKYSDDWEADNRLALIAAQQQPINFDEQEKQETQEIVEDLVNCSLVQEGYDLGKCEVVYNLHQLISEFLLGRYSNALPALFQRVQLFYQSSGIPKTAEPMRVAQILQDPLLFAFHLGDEQEAAYLTMILMKVMIQTDQAGLLDAAMRLQAASTDDYDEAAALLGMAQIHYQLGSWDAAEQYAQEALELSIAQENRSNVASALGQLGSIERNRGNWDAAEKLYRQSLQIEEELGDRSGMASSWGLLGDIERNRGNWDGAEKLYRQSLQVREELGDRSGMASSWGVLGDIENYRGNYDAAEQLKRKSFELRKELNDRPGMAMSLGAWGDIERNRGNWDGAEKLYRQSLQVREELGDRSGMASSWGQLGYIERNRGNWDGAEKLYRQSLQLMEELGDRSGMASSWGQLGYIESCRGNWDAAEKLYRQSLQLMEELGDRSGMASSWGQLGYIESCRGNWDAAEKLYRQSLQIEEELGDRSGMASSWGLLGDIERNRGNWDGAEKLYRQSLQVREELGDRSGMASSWGVLGDIERNRGNWDEAEKLYRQSLQLMEELGDRSGMASSWGLLGDIERNRGNWDGAEQFYRKSMQLSQELGSTWHLAHNHYDFAQLERQRGNAEKAQEYYAIAHQLFTQLGAAKDLEKLEREWH